MQTKNDSDIIYLLVQSQIPAALPTLTVAGPRAQPTDAGQTISSGDRRERGGSSQGTDASHRNPLVGQWYLQDDVGDYGVTMLAAFDEQGGFRMDTIALDLWGSEDREAVVGTYLVRGNTLFLQPTRGLYGAVQVRRRLPRRRDAGWRCDIHLRTCRKIVAISKKSWFEFERRGCFSRIAV